jgi:hypothetical protein
LASLWIIRCTSRIIAPVRFFETPKIRAVSKGVAGRLLLTLIGRRMWPSYAAPDIYLSRVSREILIGKGTTSVVPQAKTKSVIPNRAESPVRNLLSADLTPNCGCPILRVLCEGWDSTRRVLDFA